MWRVTEDLLESIATGAAILGTGGDASSVEVVEIDEVPLPYVPSNATLIRVKAVGNLALNRT